jgi:hypothetical protein
MTNHPFQQQSEGSKRVKTDAEREESFPLLLSTKIPLLKSTNLCLKKKMVLVQSMAQGVIV